jgi:membrane protein YfhO
VRRARRTRRLSNGSAPRSVRFSRTRGRVWSGRDYLAAAAILGALALGFFNPIFRVHATFSDVAGHQTVVWPWAAQQNGFGDTFPQNDQADDFYPWEVFEHQSLRSGEFPLWNRYVFGGTPFLTNGSGGASYPPRALLALTVPASWAHDLFLLFHVFLSGLAMFFFLKELRTGFLGSLLAAVAWTFSSYTFAWIQLEYVVVVGVCLPAALALAHRAVRRRSWLAAMGAGVVLGVCSLSTVFITLLVFPVVLLYAFALALPGLVRARGFVQRARSLAEPVTTALTALGAGAMVLLPTALMTSELGRYATPYDILRDDWAVPWSAFAPEHLFAARPEPVSTDLLHEMVFVGTPVMLLAVCGALRRAPGAALGRWLMLGTLLVTVGTPALWVVYHVLPGFAYFRPLGRALFLWCFAVALLGGIGLDGIIRWFRAPTLGGTRAVIFGTVRARLSNFMTLYRRAGLGLAVVFGMGTIAWTATQLIQYGRKINPPFQPRRADYLYPATSALAALRDDRDTRPRTEPLRILPIRRDPIGVPFTAPTMYASHSMIFQIESGAGYESLFPERISDIWRVVAGETPEHVLENKQYGAYFPSFFVGGTRFDLLPRLGVTTIYAPPDVDREAAWNRRRYAPLSLAERYSGPDGRVFDIRNAAPRAYVVYRSEIIGTRAQALARFTDLSFPFRRVVIFEHGTGTHRAVERSAPQGPPAKLTHVDANSETYAVSASAPGWLVIASMWAPGWHASVNGHGTRVFRADFNLRAVAVPPGHSVIRLMYRPAGLLAGVTVSGTTLLAVPAFMLLGGLRRRYRMRARRASEPQ